MELDEMKQAWQQLDKRLAQQHALNVRIFRDGRADRLRRGLRSLVWGQAMQIVLGAAILLWGVTFWATHTGVWQAMACGIAMQAFGTLAIIFPARVLSFLRAVDYAAPVLEIQGRLARLRAWRVKVEAPVFALLGSVIWIPALLMLMQYAGDRAGVDPWGHLSGAATWLLLNAGVSLAVVGLAYMVLRRVGRRGWLEDQLAGRAIRNAEATLEEIARFEREV